MTRSVISYKDGHVYEFAPEMEPLYTAEDGESITFETIDSLNKAVQSDADLMDAIPEEVNAATGPVAVEGATPGDILKVEIEDVRVNEDKGRVITAPGFGLLQDHEEIEHPATRVTEITNDGESLSFNDIEVPVEPVIGTIGVATSEETITTLTPHDHGGNLDTTDMSAGTTAYFPVFQEGAMLAMGDSKAAMADGEMCGTGSEIGTDIDVTVSVISDATVDLERPLVDTGDAWKTIASAETLEEAVKMANEDLIKLLAVEHGYTLTDAYLFSSLVGGLEISQVVDPLVTVRNSIPNEYLSDPL
ncbi:acetamidase/formamidase family protein [Halorubrum sp. SD626R]|uniref:acetamidase/formamidase family protein n=1 Tax=Halorubrum sp. SD626R TaxID=1419722 RepID=UPI000B07DEF3|nr:acetamidase/formamidase family protein [Halorubrum sp. SD626R]TKX81836.1 acetamidase [Halorubrum sp. SD626R]